MPQKTHGETPAFVQKSWLDCGKSLLHTRLGSHHVLFLAMLHSLLVPHIVVTMLQNWLGLGHAAFVQQSWLDCCKSLLHTKLGSHHVFFAAMLHSQFVPHIVAHCAPKLARSWPCSLCAVSHDWTVVQSLLTAQRLHGLKTDASFLRAMLQLTACAPHCECSNAAKNWHRS